MAFFISLMLVAILLPIGYGLLILWGVKYRFRSTTRGWLIATTVAAFWSGFFAWLMQ